MARSCRVTILISSLQRLPIAIPGPLRAREQRAVHLCRNKLSGRGMVLESPAFTRSCSDSFPHQGITFTMIVSRNGTRRIGESQSLSEGTRSGRPNIPLQTMAIKITTEVNHDADSASQSGVDNVNPEFKSAALDAVDHEDIHANLKYSPAISFEGSMA